jgi:acetolactate synthase I/II/III large subunit
VVWVVWNNQGYCSIHDIQHGMFGDRELATSFETMQGNKTLYSPRSPVRLESSRIALPGRGTWRPP